MEVKEARKLLEKVKSGEVRTLKFNSKFKFQCKMCGRCCFDNSIIINIYDLIRIRNSLKMSTNEILKKELVKIHIGPSSGVPVLTINFENKLKKCPFLGMGFAIPANKIKRLPNKLTPKKLKQLIDSKDVSRLYPCTIHKDRPLVCRFFPVGRFLHMKKKGGDIKKTTWILQNATCAGGKISKEWTLKEWLDDIEYKNYNEGSLKANKILCKIVESKLSAKGKKDREKKSEILGVMANLVYNFDITKFAEDPTVKKTITDDKATQEDFMHVLTLIEKTVDLFLLVAKKAPSMDRLNKIIKEFRNDPAKRTIESTRTHSRSRKESAKSKTKVL